MKHIISIILFSLLSVNIFAKSIRIDINQDIQKQFNLEKATYIISGKIDLHDENLSLPQGSTLLFEEGSLFSNGTIEGNNSVIEANNTIIFDNSITIRGTWRNSIVYSTWFQFTDKLDSNKQWDCIMILCTGKRMTDLYSPDTTYYVSAIKESAPIRIPSNVTWHNQSTIKLIGCSFAKYSIVLMRNVENIMIDGGTFYGDVETHSNSDGQWGHGIKIGGAKNITLKNITCSYCWGDGIDLIEGFDQGGEPTVNCRNIIIDNVQCLFNRRQGLSIEAAENVLIQNSEFAYTGTPSKHDPAAGIDIEPWTDNVHKISHITIQNCHLHDNLGHDLLCMANWMMKDDYHTISNNINIKNCEIGKTWVTRTSGISFIKCNLKKRTAFYMSNNVRVEQSLINRLDHKQVKHFKKKKCAPIREELSYNTVIPLIGVASLGCLVALAILNKNNTNENRNHYNS